MAKKTKKKNNTRKVAAAGHGIKSRTRKKPTRKA